VSASTTIDSPALEAAALAAAPTHDGVIGVGVDAVDVDRLRRILARRPGFADRFFTPTEQADARRSPDPTESLAARFAAKEAVMKALGTGLGGFALVDVEVRRTPGDGATAGAPQVVLYRAAAALAERRGAGALHLSLTHTATVAVAFVVAERSLPCSLS
jgi:holo-[acyl-carrier protein] synthase